MNDFWKNLQKSKSKKNLQSCQIILWEPEANLCFCLSLQQSRNSVCLSIRPSICLTFCLSVTGVLCDKTKWSTADIFIPHERAITLVYWHQQWLVGDAPFPLISALKVTHTFEKRRLRQISAYNVSTVKDSGKIVMMNIKSTTRFTTSYRWSTYVPPSPLKGGSKRFFFVFWVKVNGWSSQALST